MREAKSIGLELKVRYPSPSSKIARHPYYPVSGGKYLVFMRLQSGVAAKYFSRLDLAVDVSSIKT
jgi:hypothetical protein